MKELAPINKYFIKYKWRFILGILFVIASNYFAVLPPNLVKDMLDEVFQFFQKKDISKDELLKTVFNFGLLLILFAVLKGVFMFFMRQTIIVMSRHIEYDQKNEIYDHYQKLDTAFYRRNNTGDLMSRISEDVSRVRQYYGPALMYVINLIALTVLCLWNMYKESPSLTFYSVVPLPILAVTIYYVNKIVNRKGSKIQEQLSKITSTAQEAYSGIRVIKSFHQEDSEREYFGKESELYRKSNIDLAVTEAIYFPAMNLFIGISTLMVILIGGYQVMNGNITPGVIPQFVMYITMLTFPISAIGWTANMIQRAIVSQKRINEFLHTDPDIQNVEDAQALSIDGNVVFKDVSFTYPHTGIEALKHFDMDIKAGEKVCIIGKTGSGKSTLSHLLLRMYDTTKGTIKIDEHNIQEISLESLRSQISYVPQEVFLFSDTIYNNIAFSNHDREEELIYNAAKNAAIDNEIRELPNGYDTVVGERGVMLSGGQKQRISIARALAKSPKILLMDESLSAVDTRTEQKIQQNLKTALKNTTTIIITHRIFKDWDFDQILILENGAIKEKGTHEELMEKGGYYKKLYEYQTVHETD